MRLTSDQFRIIELFSFRSNQQISNYKKIAEEIILISLKVVNMAENINHMNQNKEELLKLMHTLYQLNWSKR